MSEQEHHQILGSSVIELRQARATLAALMAKARAYADAMRVVAQELNHVEIQYGPGAFPTMSLAAALHQYPDRAPAEELLNEIRDTTVRIKELEKSISEMGG